MKGAFGEIVSASAEWTGTVLFRPFNFRKWVSLLFIALFAFQVQGGCNMNMNLGKDRGGAARFTAEQLKTKFINIKRNAEYRLSGGAVPGKTVKILLVAIAALILSLILITQWFYSIFSFAFIDAIVNNEHGFRELFKRNRALGNSYFGWNLIVLCALAVIVMALWSSRYLSLLRSPSGIAPFAVITLTLLIVGGFLAILINDYALVVMFKRKLTIFKAIPVAANILSSHSWDFFRYIFVKAGLYILTAIMGGMITIAAAITMAIPLIAIAGVFALSFKALPAPARPFLIGIGAALGVPLATALLILAKLLILPFSVFLKTFNLKFIARLDEGYDLFSLGPSKGDI
jgi:hypothetical protein